ncbi:MAG: InlB B-repeat-containing protein, partial [Clostridia bacterium]|nr:InlB B-repeat-containing protein [Clostridia bacterium]
MKGKSWKGLCCAVLALATVGLGACGGEKEPESYTIQYTDGTNTHTLKVGYGDTYSFENIPERYGYEFLGWYDMETGGTKYVNANGMCASPYMTDGNVILYPHFQAKEYTLIFDYQGAAVSGARSQSVEYDSTLYGLPTNLTLANQTFLGWYTEPNEQGTQIADEYGVLPALKVNEKLFDLSDEDGKIYLYAGFKGVEYSVSLHFSSNLTEEIKVEHGTNIKDMLYETRLDGQ